jgi:hypothetical protein
MAPGARSLGIPARSNSTPWVTASGSFVAVTWSASGTNGDDVFLAVSRDSGRSFGPPVQVNEVNGEARTGGEIAPRVQVAPHRERPGADPAIAVLWNANGTTTAVKVRRSFDGGRTFEPSITLQDSGAGGDRGWPALAMDGRGTVHAIWLDHRGLGEGTHHEHAGQTAHADHEGAGTHDGVAMAQRSGLYYAGSDGDGVFSRERELSKGVCYCCKTALVAGPDDTLYAAWRHVFPGDLRDIAFTMSRDGGRSFSEIVRVSEDGWAINGCPDDGPAMAVDAEGTVHIVWPTAVGDAEPRGALFYASTRDGQTFTPRTLVPTLGSPKPSHPQVVVDQAGRAIVAWDEFIDGRRVAAAREVRSQGAGIAFGNVMEIAPDGPSLYPVLAATTEGLVAVWTTGGEQSEVRVRTIALP